MIIINFERFFKIINPYTLYGFAVGVNSHKFPDFFLENSTIISRFLNWSYFFDKFILQKCSVELMSQSVKINIFSYHMTSDSNTVTHLQGGLEKNPIFCIWLLTYYPFGIPRTDVVQKGKIFWQFGDEENILYPSLLKVSALSVSVSGGSE